MTKTTSKKLLALLLAVIMSLSLLPVSVLSAGLDGEPEDAPQVTAPVEQQEDDTQAPTDEPEDKTDDAVLPTDETGDKTEDAAPSDDAQAPSDDAQAPAADAQVPADDAQAPADETEDKTDDAAPTDETEDKTDDAVLPIDETDVVPAAWYSNDVYEYNIMFLDCGRKYFSVDNIKQIIDNASAAGFNYIQLAVGNDGLRFLLNDMSLTVGETTYTSEQVSAAIHAGNEAYYNFTVDELTQSEMDTIIAYANTKGMGVIPCVNSPGHMDAILSAATSLTGKDCSYSSSARTIDVTNSTAVAFTKALLQKYINYFAAKGCKLFNMGADEYANDKFTGGSMGFGNLQTDGKYSYYVNYVNAVAAMIKNAGMTPMAFNDGIYFANNTSSGTFDTDIIICYWSNGWSGYSPMSAVNLAKKGFKLINTHGDYYWVLGKSDWQCSPTKASNFNYQQFQGSIISNPAGSMFCIWCDYPGAETEASVISKTAATIAAFGGALPQVTPVQPPVVDVPKTDDKTGVSVTAPGLTELTVTEVPATPAIPNAAADKVVAYDVTPATADGTYTGEATVSFPIPDGWNTDRVRGFVVNEDGTISDGLSGTMDGSSFTFTAPHFSVMGIYQLAAGAATEPVNVIVPVGGTTDVPVPGKYLTGDYTTDNESIATVTVTGQDATTGTVTYDPVEKSYGTLAGSNTSWTKTEYFYLKDGSYYPVHAYRESYGLGYYNYYVGYSKTDSEVDVETAKSSRWGSTTITVYTKGGTAGTPASSTITFTGNSVGNTFVIIDDVQYNISVVASDNAMTGNSITLEYWITNNKVYDGQSNSTNHTKTITTATTGVTGDEGVAIGGLAPQEAYSFFDGTVTVHYWQTMRLDKSHKQTDKAGVDQTAEGTTMTHIRYQSGAWQYKTLDGAWNYFENGDQLVAYYLQKTEVTDEVITYVKDWGYGTGSNTPDTSSGKGQAALTVAAVYPDGTVSPTEGEMYSKSTTIFNFWTDRDIGIVAPKSNDLYNISKITVTDGRRTSSTTANVWYASDTITWEKKINAAGEQWYDETEVWNKDSGTTPMVNGAVSGIKWSAKNTAKLVLIYLEPVEKETNLHVHYVDDGNNTVFHQYQVAMKYHESDPIPTFTAALTYNGGVIGDKGPWNSNVQGDTHYLPDEAYVVNATGTHQTFKKDITTIPGIHAIYASGLYEYLRADISEDGKTLSLYYGLKPTEDKTFVVDFGLPVEIQFADFGIANYNTDINVSLKEGSVVHEQQGNYGRCVIAPEKKTVTYTLNKMLDKKVPIPVYVWGSGYKQAIVKNVYIIPASTVYYEDDFAKFTNADKTTVVTTGTAGNGFWQTVGTKDTNAKQALDELGDQNANVYGYDSAYANRTTYSLGSATKVTVDKDTKNQGGWPYATFTFKGTGFDIISLTDNKSGAIYVDVYKGDSIAGQRVSGYVVNNYYGYTYTEAGGWQTTTDGANNAIYQVPVIKVSDLTYDQYTVKIMVGYSQYQDLTGDNQYSFWLDAIRVYNPGGSALDNAYDRDGEKNPNFVELRKVLLDADSFGTIGTANGAVFIDGKGKKATVEDYRNYGPNHEVYLAKDQAIAFRLVANKKPAGLQLGAKLANGSSAELTITGAKIKNADKLALGTATDMFYQLSDIVWTQSGNQYTSGVITLTNSGTGMISLTNLKFIGAEYVNDASKMDEAQDDRAMVAMVMDFDAAELAIAAVDSVLHPQEAQTFTPDRFEARWSRSTVRAGQRATLTVKTSVDVEAITVDGKTVTSYRTRTQRTGWGKHATKVTYREFTYTMTATKTADHMVTAVNAQGIASDPITAKLTVQAAVQRPQRPGWWDKLFGRWS